MPAEVDVIVSAFAAPPRDDIRALAQNVYLFDRQPVILHVPYHQWLKPEDKGMAAGAFSRAAQALRGPDGSILKSLFRRYLKGHDVRSVSVVSFSAGNVFTHNLMKSPDAEWIDSVIVLDGLHLNLDWKEEVIASEIKPWVDFAEKAARDERLMALVHTHITPRSKAVASTERSSRELIYALDSRLGANPQWWGPELDLDLIFRGPPPPGVSIRCGNPATTKVFEESPLLTYDQRGNFWNFDYGGTGGPDHCYVAWYAQRDLWAALLAPRLNGAATCRIPDLSGLGADQCIPNRVLVPEGVYPTGSVLTPLLAMLGGLGVGTAVGYAAGCKLGA